MHPVRVMLFAFLLLIISPPVLGKGKQITIGLISDKPVGRIREYNPLAQYLADNLNQFGISRGRVVIVKNTDQMIRKIKAGEVDIVFETAFSTLEMSEKAGIKPQMLIWKKGQREYSSVIFVRKESSIREIQDLKGKSIVFEDPQSTSAYLLPKTDLMNHGLALVRAKEKGTIGAVRYVFGGEETNQAFFVIQKKTDAGAFSSDDWKELPNSVKDKLRVIHETKPVIRSLASFHPSLPEELNKAITGILTAMHATPAGRNILDKAAGTERVEPLTEKDYRSLSYVRELMEYETGNQ